MGVPLGLQRLHGGGGGVQPQVHAQLLQEGRVPVNGLSADAEIGDHPTDHTPQGVRLLKEGDGHPSPGAEEGRRHAGGAAADDGRPPVVPHRRRGAQLCQDLLISPLRCRQLPVPDLDRPVIEVPGALVHAAVGTDSAGDEGQGVLFQNDLQSLGVPALAAELHVLRDVLTNGAAALAGGGEAVHEGNPLRQLPPGQGLDRLHVEGVPPGRQGQGLHPLCVHPGEGGEGQGLQLLRDLGEPLIAAGLEGRGGHGDRPDPALEEPVNVEVVRAAGVAQPQASVKVPAHPPGHLNGQGEEALAGHVHLLRRQLPVFHLHGEGVGQLQAELQSPLPGQGQQAAEHGDGVPVL